MPSKADVITVRSLDGTKLKLQKRHLVMTLGEAYQMYKADCQHLTIGQSKFASLRPKNVPLTSQMPHNVCSCKYHSNMALVTECVHCCCSRIVPSKLHEVVSLCVCDKNNESCMSRECADGKLFTKTLTK